MLTYIRRKAKPSRDVSTTGINSLQMKILNDPQLAEWQTFLDLVWRHKGSRNGNQTTKLAIQGLVVRGLLEKKRL